MKNKEVRKILDNLNKEISERKVKFDIVIKKEMDNYKGKYFKNKEEDDVKLSVFFVSGEYWDNAIDYVRSFYCESESFGWWQIDEEMNLEYSLYDLSKLEEAEEITEKEYLEIREIIVNKAKEKEIEKLKNKYEEKKEFVKSSKGEKK